MGINDFITRFSIPGFSAKTAIKAVTGADDLYTDEQGRHVIFRNIGGQVRPIHVGPEDYAEWLVNQNVNIDPADQKTLREIDKELEIMEKAAQYGGSALQKKYEDYFKERRKQYSDIASGYYQTALQNQAQANNTTVEELSARKKDLYEKNKDDIVKRSELPNKGWDSSIKRWVEYQDSKKNLTPKDDDWYYTRLYGVMLSELVDSAKENIQFSELDLNKVFSNEFFDKSLQNHYAKYFAAEGTDPKKVIAAIKTMQNYFLKDAKGTKNTMMNFLAYWYNKMEADFAEDEGDTLASSPEIDALTEVPQDVVPKSLPNTFNKAEKKALISMYDRASGSKLSAAHRVMIHGISRVIDSIPMKDRVSAAVELADGSKGLHAAHKEGYERAFTNNESLGLSEDRRSLVENALDIISAAADGTSKQKVAALKRVSMIMGMIDGEAVISSNPGIKKQQFMKRWTNTSTNAGRAKSEGPGLIDLITDEDRRNSYTYTNNELKIIHGDEKKKPVEDEVTLVMDSPEENRKEEEKTFVGPTQDGEREGFEGVTTEDASFRVPLFNFPQNIPTEDRKFLDSLNEYIGQKGLSFKPVGPSIYRVQNPANDKYIDILYNNNKRKIIGVSRDENNKILPIPSLSLEEIEKILNLSAPEKTE
jgi:hypothetical protein